jgi:serine/threonine protein kinase/formylglycine-generating enzyme required for sulfatase activity
VSNGLFEGNKYKVENEILGENSLILKAYDNELKMFVAIKSISSNVLGIPEAEEQFIEECQLLARIHGDHVLRVLHFYEKGKIGDRAYLVMEWMDETLEQVLGGKPISPVSAMQVLKKIASGLGTIHREGVIHHDITPENITISSDLRDVKIGDLGFAAEVGKEKTHLFTPKYTAPENYYPDQPVGKQSDIYSLGIIAYELFLGRTQFRAAFDEIYSEKNDQVRKSRWQHWHMNQGKKASSLSAVDSAIQSEISDIVGRMMAKSPEERYFDVEDILSDLEAIDPSNSTYIKPINPEDYESQDDNKSLLKRLMAPKALGLIILLIASFSVSGYFLKDYLDQKKLNTTLLATLEKVKELRQDTKDAGADESVEPFVQAEGQFDAAKGFYAKGAARDSLVSLIAAAKSYRSALEILQDKLPSARQALEENQQTIAAYLKYIGPQNQGDLEQELEAQYAEWNRSLAIESPESVLEAEKLWIAALDDSLASLPRTYIAGSTPEEIDEAVATCDRTSTGCEKSWYETEAMREVILKPFTLDKTEVSKSQFAEFVADTDYITTAESLGYAYLFDGEESVRSDGFSWKSSVHEGPGGQGNLPVMYTSAVDADRYCRWRSARLPTGEEWEYASRGPERFVYSWGNEWTRERVSNTATVVGSDLQETFFTGLADMTGNVWEWVRSNNRNGLKGGSYLESTAANFRSAAEREQTVDVVNIDDGFRCASDAELWPEHRADNALKALN